mmetsp:Transcript_40151/g.73501  ORF Transcript_40151/g.73501 Transcript_40151/m.73501 type:complete len:111 (-) Transcript_40151:586-918(-)
MMQRALKEDKYSSLGSVVNTNSSDNDDHGNGNECGIAAIRWNHRPKRGPSSEGLDSAKPWVDRSKKRSGSDGNAKASAREGDEIGAELMGGNFWTMPRTIWSMAGAGVRL